MSDIYELRDRILGVLGEAFDVDNATIADRILVEIEERIEDYRAGIDQAAEMGSDKAAAATVVLNELQDALFRPA